MARYIEIFMPLTAIRIVFWPAFIVFNEERDYSSLPLRVMISNKKSKIRFTNPLSVKAIQSYMRNFEEAVRNFEYVKEEERQQINLLIRKRFSGMI